MYREQTKHHAWQVNLGVVGLLGHRCQPKPRGEIVVHLTFGQIRPILPILTTSPDEILADPASK